MTDPPNPADPGPPCGAAWARAHQLRAADHFLDQDSPEDHDTGGWLIATARELATRLAGDIDDHSAGARRSLTLAAGVVAWLTVGEAYTGTKLLGAALALAGVAWTQFAPVPPAPPA